MARNNSSKIFNFECEKEYFEEGRKEMKGAMREETLWCLWKHFKSFLEQSIEEKTADFGKPCSDCKLWDGCKGNWRNKIGESKPSEITINVGRVPE